MDREREREREGRERERWIEKGFRSCLCDTNVYCDEDLSWTVRLCHYQRIKAGWEARG